MDEPLRILIVEDNIADAKRARIMLDEANIRAVVGMAHSIAEAKRLLNPTPDVVLLDLGLPGVEGTEALQAVVEVAPETIAIVVTGSDSDALMLETAGYGAHDYIHKSELSSTKLERAIVSALAQRARHQKDLATMTNIEMDYGDVLDESLDPDPIRILYVEDNVNWPSLMARLLGPHFKVEAVPRLSMAFERAARSLPDLVLLDMHLPDSPNPDETLPRMLSRGFGVPIALISACYADEVPEMQRKAIEAGAVGFISKDGENGRHWGHKDMVAVLRERFTLWGELGRAVKLERLAMNQKLKEITSGSVEIAAGRERLTSLKARA